MSRTTRSNWHLSFWRSEILQEGIKVPVSIWGAWGRKVRRIYISGSLWGLRGFVVAVLGRSSQKTPPFPKEFCLETVLLQNQLWSILNKEGIRCSCSRIRITGEMFYCTLHSQPASYANEISSASKPQTEALPKHFAMMGLNSGSPVTTPADVKELFPYFPHILGH